jgi:HEAT repeat protein
MARLVAVALALAACLPLAAAEPASKEIQKLEKQLAKDRDASVRAEAAWQLGQKGATGSVPLLIGALGDSSSAVRANAAASLWKLGAPSKPAIPALRKALDDSSAAVVGNAAGALRALDVPKAELLPAYQRLLTRPDCESRVTGVKGLVGEVPPTKLFDHAWECGEDAASDADVKRDAREALREILDRRDRVLVPRVLEVLEIPRNRDKSDLVSHIVQLKPPVQEAVPVLTELIADRNEYTQKSAIDGLGRLGPVALPAVPALIECLHSKAPLDARESAAEALGRIGPKAAKTAVPALIKAAQDDKWPKVRRASLSALGEMGPSARAAVPVLRAALEDPDGFISLAARNALFRVEPNQRQEVAAIADKSRPKQEGSLFEDPSGLSSTLPSRIPEAHEVVIYEKFAMATVPYPESQSGRGTFTYRAGTVTGPEQATSDDCTKKITLSKVDFSVVPRLVRQAPGLLGAPAGKVSHVSLTSGVFCKAIGWVVYVEGAGFVEFKLDGKLAKVQKL